MKKNRKYKIILMMLVLELLVVGGLGSAASYFNQTEDFEEDTVGSDPSETWYTYEETASFNFSNVVSGGYAGSNGFRVNDTDPYLKGCWFNFTSDNYSYVEFYFKIDNSTHNQSRIFAYDSVGTTLGRFEIRVNRTGVTDYNYVLFKNYSGVAYWNGTITNDTWYRLRFTFNVTSNYLGGTLYNAAGTVLNTSWFEAEYASGAYDYSNFYGLQISGINNDFMYIWFDNIKLFKSYDWGSMGETTNYLLQTVVPILFAVFLLIVIIGMALSGAVDINGMIALMLAAIIGMVALTVVFAL